jgi:hypothetical protein
VQQHDDFPFIALIELYHGFSKSKLNYNTFSSYATSATFKWVGWDNINLLMDEKKCKINPTNMMKFLIIAS